MFSFEAVGESIRISLQPITATKHLLYSADAEELLLMIACHESILGKHLHQIGGGPGRGLFQVEPRTMHDNYVNFIDTRLQLARQIREVSGVPGPDDEQLTYNPLFGAIMARIGLYRCPGELPPANDLPAMAKYANLNCNSISGAATTKAYLADYNRLVLVSSTTLNLLVRKLS